MKTYSEKSGCATLTISGVICLILIIISTIYAFNTNNYKALTVTDKSYSGSEDGFIVWMEDEDGTQYEFTNKDQLIHGKFNSSTVQGKLKVGETYNIKTCGWRWPLFSWYENIIEYELIEDNN